VDRRARRVLDLATERLTPRRAFGTELGEQQARREHADRRRGPHLMAVPLAPDDIVATRGDIAADAREPLVVLDALTSFLDEHGVGAAGSAPELTPIGDGHSNVTFAVTRGDTEVVLRRPPRGPLPPSAHDVLREARVITALDGRARVPKALAVGDDPELIGAPFYVMERVEGDVLGDTLPPHLDDEAGRRRVGEELIDALVELHAVDWRAAGLEGFGRPEGYLARQLRRFLGLWEHNKTREVLAVDAVGRWLGERLPDSPPATIVHGDFRLGNTLFARTAPAHLSAILDWEMATIGDPLADLGYLMVMWSDRDDPEIGGTDLSPVTRQPGFPTRDELVARYEERSGRSTGDLGWYRVLASWKLIVFMEGNYKRAMAGTTDDPFILQFGSLIEDLAARAEDLTHDA
jgi:aminoglycoside phosphotransferase (APT) family kinase protein